MIGVIFFDASMDLVAVLSFTVLVMQPVRDLPRLVEDSLPGVLSIPLRISYTQTLSAPNFFCISSSGTDLRR